MSPTLNRRSGSVWQKASLRLALFVSACCLVSCLAKYWWVADLIANLRVQLLIGMVLSLVCLAIGQQWKWLVGVTLLTLWQLSTLSSAWVAGERVVASQQTDELRPADDETIRLLLANVLTSNDRYELILEQLRAADADVWAILELSPQLSAAIDREFAQEYPHRLVEAHEFGNFGIGLWSRLPLVSGQIVRIGQASLPSIEVEVKVAGKVVRILATHPLPPMGADNFAHRNQQLAMVASHVRSSEPSPATIVVGDLNLTPWSPHFDQLCQASGLASAAAGRGLAPTWYLWEAFPFGLVLDHALYSLELRCIQRQILPYNGSDHRGVLYRFRLSSSD